jgi:hypothetical protein
VSLQKVISSTFAAAGGDGGEVEAVGAVYVLLGFDEGSFLAANYVAKQMDIGIRGAVTVDVARTATSRYGRSSTRVDNPPPTTDQKVGGSTPSERAELVQVRASRALNARLSCVDDPGFDPLSDPLNG